MNKTTYELEQQELIHAVSLPDFGDRQSTWRNETFTGYLANAPDSTRSTRRTLSAEERLGEAGAARHSLFFLFRRGGEQIFD